MRTHTTLGINPKGGSGKTTVATNLASYFAANQVATALMDYDPQGSSLNWLRQRPMHLTRIHPANAAPAKPGRMRSMDMRVPEDTRQLVIDAPAGASGLLLQVGRESRRVKQHDVSAELSRLKAFDRGV